jgi:gas vesicle protein
MKVSSFCIGLGMGAILGILFAPKSGKETRKDLLGEIKGGIDEATDNVQKFAKRARKAVSHAADSARNRVSDIAEAATGR